MNEALNKRISMIAQQIADSDALCFDGDTVTIGGSDNPLTITLRIRPDDMSILDESGEGTFYGELVERDQRVRGGRPRHFNGKARIIRNGSYQFWWQPPADVNDPKIIDDLMKMIQRIMEEGYYYLELSADGHSAILGGIEPSFTDSESKDWRIAVITDLIVELLGEVWSV